MNIIKIRNSLLVTVLLIGIFYPVSAVTRIISDSNDNYYTFIRNTKGNIWEPTGANLQAAINDIGTDGGTVYVGSDITLTNSLTLKNYCIVDFQGNTITLQNNKPFINISYSLDYSTVRNVNVIVSDGQSSPVIYFYSPAGGTKLVVRHNSFENIYIKNPSPLNTKGEWTEHNYIGIGYLWEGPLAGTTSGSTCLCNLFKNIHMEGPKVGILFGHYASNHNYPNIYNVTHWINGEYFENIFIDQFESAVLFNTTYIRLCNEMVFNNLIAKTASYSRYGIMNISRAAPIFIGGVIDWYKAVNPVALFSTDKQWDYKDNGYAVTYGLYVDWQAPYDATYMTDIGTTIYYYNFLIADGKIKWERP
jgi:hypothetical protein